jgi:hypothetical protein
MLILGQPALWFRPMLEVGAIGDDFMCRRVASASYTEHGIRHSSERGFHGKSW